MAIGPGGAVTTSESTKKGTKCNKMNWAAVNSWKYNVYKTMILLIDLESSHYRQNVPIATTSHFSGSSMNKSLWIPISAVCVLLTFKALIHSKQRKNTISAEAGKE